MTMISSHPLHALGNMSVHQGARRLPVKAVPRQPGPYTCHDLRGIVDNDTAHDNGKGFAEATLRLLPDFIADARALADMIEAAPDD